MWDVVASIAAPIVGGLIGAEESKGSAGLSEQILKDLYAKYANLQIPDIEKQRLLLEELKSVGAYNPELEQLNQLGARDAMQDIAVDPRLRQAQINQLETLQKLADTGMTPAELNQMRKMQRGVEADNQSRLSQILQQQDMRGVGSSTAGLAARLQASQSAANRQADMTQDTAAQAFNRALQARAQAGSLAGSMEGQQFSQGAQIAEALNRRELANFNQKNTIQQRNVGSKNQAQQMNLGESQRLADANVGTRNQQQMYNKELYQRQFDNEMKKLSGMQGAGNNLAGNYANDAAQTRQRWADIGAGGAKGINAYMAGQKPAADKSPVKVDPNNPSDKDPWEA